MTSVGQNALPLSMAFRAYGPVGACALRDYLEAAGMADTNYNQYIVNVYNGSTLYVSYEEEAGTQMDDFLIGARLSDGKYVSALCVSSQLAAPWDFENQTMPAANLMLYMETHPAFETEAYTYTVPAEDEGNGEAGEEGEPGGEEEGEEGTGESGETEPSETPEPVTVTGLMITGYYGNEAYVKIPESVNGTSVIAVGPGFLKNRPGSTDEILFGTGLLYIADNALTGYTGTVRTEAGTYARQWAQEHGYAAANALYTLSFDTAGGAAMAAKTVTSGTAVRLGTPVKTASEFLGWYTDELLTEPVQLDEDDLYIMPAADTTMYASWLTDTEHMIRFVWTEKNGEVTITGYTGDASDAQIPAEINGIPVTAVASEAFAGSKVLKNSTFPAADIALGENVFAGSGIETADLGGVRIIPEGTFGSLTGVTMTSVTEIGRKAFANCTSLTAAALPETLTTIGEAAFRNCDALTAVTLPDSVETVGENAFSGCASLTNMHIGAGTDELNPTAFVNCAARTAFTASENGIFTVTDGVLFRGTALACFPAGRTGSYTIPEGTTGIGAYAFMNSALTAVTVPSSVTQIGNDAFAFTAHLEELSFSPVAGCTLEIPEEMCLSASALRTVRLNTGVTAIGDKAFFGCSLLTDVHIAPTVTEIGSMAFSTVFSDISTYGATGSKAHEYAVETGFNFIDPDAAPVEEILIAYDSDIMVLGDRQLPDIQILPAAAANAAMLTWFTSDDSVLEINETTGAIVALKRGTADVYALSANGVYAVTEITVIGTLAETVVLTAPEGELVRGTAWDVPWYVLPEYANDSPMTWESDAPGTVSVDENGTLTALAEGTATITATAPGGRYAKITVSVYVPTESIALASDLQDEDGIMIMNALPMGQTAQLLETIVPADATYTDFIYATSDPQVATVDENGTVTPVHAGTAVITAAETHTLTDESAGAAIEVHVEPYDISGLQLTEECVMVYNTDMQIPQLVIGNEDFTLVQGTHFTIESDEILHAGTNPVTVTGIGDCTGTTTVSVTVAKKPNFIMYDYTDAADIDQWEPMWWTSDPAEMTVSYLADGETEATTEYPTEPGLYTVILNAAETQDTLENEESFSIYLYRLTPVARVDATCLTEGNTHASL